VTNYHQWEEAEVTGLSHFHFFPKFIPPHNLNHTTSSHSKHLGKRVPQQFSHYSTMATTTTTTPLDSTTTNTGATPMMASMDAARHPTPQEFSQAVTKIAVAHLALGVGNTDPRPPESHTPPGFTTADTRAVALLSDVIGRYIETIGLNAGENANAAGRTSTNAYDVVNALSALSPRPMSIKDLHDFARDKGLEVPFDRDVSSFPRRRDRRGRSYGSGVSPANFHAAKRPAHAPSFLPPPPELDKRIKATAMQSSTDKSKKRVRQEVESQAALTKLHGNTSAKLKRGAAGSSSSSSSSSSNGSGGSSDGSQTSATNGMDNNNPNKKPSNLRYQGTTSARR
jgi:hypothetical protein